MTMEQTSLQRWINQFSEPAILKKKTQQLGKYTPFLKIYL